MTQRQLKEREESLLSMLGYVKFTQEVNSVKELRQPPIPKNIKKDNITGNMLSSEKQQINRTKLKKEITSKYFKFPQNELETASEKRLLTDQSGKSSPKNHFLAQFYQTYNKANTYQPNNDETQFSSELPLINRTTNRLQLKQTPQNEQVNSNYFNQTKNSSTKQSTKNDLSIQQNPQDSIQIIQEIFVNQQQMQRIPTPYLTSQASSFSRTRKSLLIQLNQNPVHLEQMKKKLKQIKESSSANLKQKSVDSNRSISSIFKDLKLNIKATTNQLQKAKMLSPQQLDEISNFSVSNYVSPRFKEKQKRQLSEEKPEKQSTSYLLSPLQFQQGLHIQLKKKDQKDSNLINQIQEEDIPNLLQRRNKKLQYQVEQDTQLRQQNLISTNSNNDSSSKQRAVTESNQNNQQNRWRFNHPVQNQQLEYFGQNDQSQGSQQQIQNQQYQNLQQQTSLAAGNFHNKRNSKSEILQLGTDFGNYPQSSKVIGIGELANQLSSQSSSRLDKQFSNQKQNSIVRFDTIKQESNSKLASSRTIKFDLSQQKNNQKHKTFSLIPSSNSNQELNTQKNEKKRKTYLGNKQKVNNTLEFLDNFTQQYNSSKSLQIQQTQPDLRNGNSNTVITNKLHVNLQKASQPPPHSNQENKRNSLVGGGKSPKSSSSPIKRRLVQQQIHEDNYIAMHQGLIDGLKKNEVLTQYIEQSGYSIEMFAFYMMKLYNFCIYQVSGKRNSENSANNSIDNSGTFNGQNLNFADRVEQYESSPVKQKQEFPTLKVNEQTLLSILEIFIQKMRELSVPPQQIRLFREQFIIAVKQFMPQTFIDDLGGVDKIRLVVVKLLEHLCYESGIISSFDHSLINYVCEGSLCLLRSDQSLLEPYLNKLKSSTIPISNAEFYLVKIALGRVMKDMQYPNNIICQIIQRLNKQRGYFSTLNDFSQDPSFRNLFIQSISKNKKIVGYFLDPSQSTIQTFYEQLFQTLHGQMRYIDLIDYLEHRLKTNDIPILMIEEIHKTILEVLKTIQLDQNPLTLKDIAIKIERIKQKAGLVSYQFLDIGIETEELASQLIEWCEYALININLPKGVQEDSIIKTEFLKEYIFLVFSPDEQMFSIYDLDYAITYHNISNFEYCFELWLSGIIEILTKNYNYPKNNIDKLISYLRLHSTLQN